MDPFTLLAGGSALLGLGQSLFGMRDRKKAEQEMQKALAARPDYKIPAFMVGQLADAQSRVNAESPALRAMTEQARQQAATTMANAQRSATSGAQALGMGALAQNQFQEMLPQIALQQEQFRQNNLQRADNARGMLAQQEAMKYQDQLARYNDFMNLYMGKMGAANQNIGMGVNNALNGLMGAMKYNSPQTTPVTPQTKQTTGWHPPYTLGQSRPKTFNIYTGVWE